MSLNQPKSNLLFAKKTTPIIEGGGFMLKMFSLDSEKFGIQINEQYIIVRWKDTTTEISIKTIKSVVKNMRSLSQQRIG